MGKPFLDVSDALLDPMLADSFTVNRRTEFIDTHGRAQVTSNVIENVIGVVCAANPNDLERLPEDQRMGRHISIVTKFRLQGPSPSFQPDTVVWNDDIFIIKNVEIYNRFGKGFIQAIAGSMDFVDKAPA